MAWAYRANSYANDGTGYSIAGSGTTTVTMGAAVTAGDRLILNVMGFNSTANDAAPTYTVTDSVNAGNWNEDKTQTWTVGTNQGVRQSVFSRANSAAGTPVITLHITVAAGGAIGGMECLAYSGLLTSDPGVDVTSAGNGVSTAPSSGATAVTTAANELAYGGYVDAGDNVTTISAGGTFTQRGKHQADGGHYEASSEDEDSGASGSTITSTTGVTSSAEWGQITVVYKLAAGGVAAAPTILTRTMTGVGF